MFVSTQYAYIFVLFIVLITVTVTLGNLTVVTNSGSVRGFKTSIWIPDTCNPDITRMKTVNVWSSIPFAEPPINELRFRAPVPKKPWTGILHAREPPKSCFHQLIEFFGYDDEKIWLPKGKMSEDCLYLTIWVPGETFPPKKNIPVMIWIFGGGFATGSSALDLYDGKVFAARNDVIVVSMQYRVGLLGFLYTGTENCPGNQGIMDQSLAIKWIFENIPYFGGDQNNITIFGESSGAISVGLHYLSPKSNPYFQKAIMESGSPTAPWSVISSEIALKRTDSMFLSSSFQKALKDILLYTGEVTSAEEAEKRSKWLSMNGNYEQLIQYLRKAPVKPGMELWDMHWNNMELSAWSGSVGYGFVPVVDKNFILDFPEVLLQEGRFRPLPLLIGTNVDEGTYFNAYVTSTKDVRLCGDVPYLPNEKLFRDVLEESIFTSFPVYPLVPPKIIYDSIFMNYMDFTLSTNSTNNVLQLARACGDFHFSCPALKFADYVSKHGSVTYFYYFSHIVEYRGSSNKTWPKWMGVLHADELLFVFGDPLRNETPFHYSTIEVQLSGKIMDYWSNFAKRGNPNRDDEEIEWLDYSFPNRNYFDVNAIKNTRKHSLKANECFFWDFYIPRLLLTLGDCKSVAMSIVLNHKLQIMALVVAVMWI